MGLPSEVHGIHVASLHPAHEKLHWQKPAQRANGVRVRLHTCECKETLYELCQAGGLVFVRRSLRLAKGTTVDETEWLMHSKALRLWQLLLLGEAK